MFRKLTTLFLPKDGSLNLKNIEAGSKKMKNVFFFKERKQTA